jgi:phospholipid-binding lipoprotein MlaA|tara:strand:- start:1767 stop:2594 length:828 start_codon:yes stop_codon:yes gene_type:complete
MKSKLVLLFVLLSLSISGCASITKDEVLAENIATQKVSDPLEPFNRMVFSFNNVFDKYALRPVAILYRGVLPEFARNRITYALNNLSMPITTINNILQFEFGKAGISTARFVINSTIGILGFFDPAAYFGLEASSEDFGQTLAVWGIPKGPYLVLPLLGPSSPRDFTGLLSTSLLDPTYQIGNTANRELFRYYKMGTSAVNFRSENIELFDDLQNNSVDYYAAVRSFYNQSRNSQVSDNLEVNPSVNQDNLFNDFEEFDLDDTYIGPDISIDYPE